MRRPLSLRARLAVAVGFSALALLGAIGVLLVHVVDNQMHDNARREALRALAKAKLDLVNGVASAEITAIQPGDTTIEFVFSEQFDADGQPNADDLFTTPAPRDDTSLDNVAPGETRVVRRDVAGHPVLLAVTTVSLASGRYTLAAAAPLTETERTIATLRSATMFAVPALALALGGLATLVSGRALKPVATMRTQADAISHGTLHRRLTPAIRSKELAALAETMNGMLDRLESAANNQRRFASDASHELRSPLTTIRAMIELAAQETSSGTTPTRAVALAEIDRLDTLVNDLLTLSRLDEAGLSSPHEIDLDDIVITSAQAIGRAGLSIDVSHVGAARIVGDHNALAGLVRNLLSNAARHAESAVVVSLSQSDDGRIDLIVDDDGPGIPQHERARVFERFTRLDNARSRDAGGSGLGLAVAASATRAHGGSISVADSPTGGARLHAILSADGRRATS
jgi:signal transduction histidine kinase